MDETRYFKLIIIWVENGIERPETIWFEKYSDSFKFIKEEKLSEGLIDD